MTYLCEVCGAVFHEPAVRSYTDRGPDGIRIPYRQELCPECGEDFITELTKEEESA